MAIASNTIWECATTGLATNGGGFVPGSGGTDYSLQDLPVLALTDVAIASNVATNITSAIGGFTAAMVGNIVYLTGGSGGTLATQRRQITAFVDANTLTLDQAPAPTAAMTGVTARIGGALSGPWDVCSSAAGSSDAVAGNTIMVREGTYNRTAIWGCKNIGATLLLPVKIVGYPTGQRNPNIITLSNRPEFVMTANSTGLFSANNCTNFAIYNIVFRSTASVKASGISNSGSGSSLQLVACRFTGFSTGLAGGTSSSAQLNARLYFCEVDSCTSSGIFSGQSSGGWTIERSYIHDNSGDGFGTGGSAVGHVIRGSLIVDNGGMGVGGGSGTTSVSGYHIFDCIIANNTTGQVKFSINAAPSSIGGSIVIANSILWGGDYCVMNPIPAFDGANILLETGVYYGGAAIANLLNWSIDSTWVNLTNDPFVDAANGDYSLNTVAGGGLLCRAGIPTPAFLGPMAINDVPGPIENAYAAPSGGQASYAFIE